MNVLVTGGAGYIGSIVTEELLREAHNTIVLDNLQQGHKRAVPPEAEFVLVDICDAKALEDVFRRFKIDAVIHMAGETVVEYSVTDPKRYFQNNVVGGINLLDAMLKHDVRKLIFSSTAAVYGEPENTPIVEDHPKAPLNSYGESKLMFENVLAWYARAYGLMHISFRYFNAAGASQALGEDHQPETHLIPNILKAASNSDNQVPVFGTDYPTKDGTCIRDYIHVVDIARAHILALEKLESLSGEVYNLGNGAGYSVLEVIEAVKKVTGLNVATKVQQRRSGDPAILVASSSRAISELGWKPKYPELEIIVESAWRWMKQHLNGYE